MSEGSIDASSSGRSVGREVARAPRAGLGRSSLDAHGDATSAATTMTRGPSRGGARARARPRDARAARGVRQRGALRGASSASSRTSRSQRVRTFEDRRRAVGARRALHGERVARPTAAGASRSWPALCSRRLALSSSRGGRSRSRASARAATTTRKPTRRGARRAVRAAFAVVCAAMRPAERASDAVGRDGAPPTSAFGHELSLAHGRDGRRRAHRRRAERRGRASRGLSRRDRVLGWSCTGSSCGRAPGRGAPRCGALAAALAQGPALPQRRRNATRLARALDRGGRAQFVLSGLARRRLRAMRRRDVPADGRRDGRAPGAPRCDAAESARRRDRAAPRPFGHLRAVGRVALQLALPPSPVVQRMHARASYARARAADSLSLTARSARRARRQRAPTRRSTPSRASALRDAAVVRDATTGAARGARGAALGARPATSARFRQHVLVARALPASIIRRSQRRPSRRARTCA